MFQDLSREDDGEIDDASKETWPIPKESKDGKILNKGAGGKSKGKGKSKDKRVDRIQATRKVVWKQFGKEERWEMEPETFSSRDLKEIDWSSYVPPPTPTATPTTGRANHSIDRTNCDSHHGASERGPWSGERFQGLRHQHGADIGSEGISVSSLVGRGAEGGKHDWR